MTKSKKVQLAEPDMTPEVVVGEIIKIVNVLNENEMGDLSEDTLARVALKLAAYKATLGTYVSQAHREEFSAEADYYVERAEAYQKQRDEGKGSTDANELKHISMRKAYDKLHNAKYTYERLSRLHGDCKEMIEAIRSQVIRLQTERKDASRGN